MTIDQKALEAAREAFTERVLPLGKQLERAIIAYIAARPAPDHAGLASRVFYPVNNPSAWPDGFNQNISDLLREAATALSAQADDNASYDDGYQDGLHDGNGDDIVRAVAAWLDNHLGKGNWYDEAAEGFSADDVVQALNEAVREPDTALSAASPAPLEGITDELVERAFKDGLAYGSNVEGADPETAWMQSRVRASLGRRALKNQESDRG